MRAIRELDERKKKNTDFATNAEYSKRSVNRIMGHLSEEKMGYTNKIRAHTHGRENLCGDDIAK